MENELTYLQRRANFHRRMARSAACVEARCAHEGFVKAYAARIDRMKSAAPSPQVRALDVLGNVALHPAH